MKQNGCLTLIFSALIGGLCLQYDLNHWLPVLHHAFPSAINNPGEIAIWPWLFLAGIPLGSIAFTVAVVTFLAVVVGIIA